MNWIIFFYFQVQIEGFDPDKFRAANSVHSSSSLPAPSLLIGQRPSMPVARPESLPGSMPVPLPAVPSYDPLEQQLLKSIEQELGMV